MATKSTKFSYTNLSKSICLILSVLLFALGTFFAVNLGTGVLVLGGKDYLSGAAQRLSFSETEIFDRINRDDRAELLLLTERHSDAFRKALADSQKKSVDWTVKQYIARQSYLKQEKSPLDGEFFQRDLNIALNYDNTNETAHVSFYYQTMALSEKALRAELNRQYDEFEQEEFNTYLNNYTLADSNLREHSSLKFYVKSADGSVYTNLDTKPSLKEIEQHTVYGFVNDKVTRSQGLAGIHHEDGSNTNSFFDRKPPKGSEVAFYLDEAVIGKEPVSATSGLLLSRTLYSGDQYIAARHLYDIVKQQSAGAMLALTIISYLAGLILLLWLLHLVGHINETADEASANDGEASVGSTAVAGRARSGRAHAGLSPEPARYAKDGSRLVYATIDRFPGDIHFLLSAALASCAVLIPALQIGDKLSSDYSYWPYFPLIGATITLVSSLFLAEWLSSVCRTVKSGRGFWKNTLIWHILRWFGRLFQKLFRYCKKTWHFVEYSPKHLKKQACWLSAGYVVINLILAALASARGVWQLLGIVGIIVFNIVVVNKIAGYLKGLDEIIEASEDGAEMAVDASSLPVSLAELADNMALSQERIDAAVEKAVKEEQTRTELITNVTHDLKTPLTSLINYSDLLTRKSNVGALGDEESLQYVTVINDQSVKLKHLIDDLLEASKASAGNVQLNCTTLNLTELAAQAIAEFAPEMEKNHNEIVFVDANGQPAAAEHLIYADGPKTYRILSNLLSNTRKYSAPGTRVYAMVSDGPAVAGTSSADTSDATGAAAASLTTKFELKNISAAPLNISPEELMERFVRGDRSRGETEGNGLGLSIARDLATLMGGSLELSIDGDLFKATVTLPKQPLDEKN